MSIQNGIRPGRLTQVAFKVFMWLAMLWGIVIASIWILHFAGYHGAVAMWLVYVAAAALPAALLASITYTIGNWIYRYKRRKSR